MELKIRLAAPEDAEGIAPLVIISDPDLFSWFFGEKAMAVLEDCARGGHNLFSWENALVCEADGELVAAMMSFPSQFEGELTRGMEAILKRHYGPPGRLELQRKSRLFEKHFKYPENSYYFQNLAVYPAFRGMGIARKLLATSEGLARAAGCDPIMLEVRDDKPKLIEFYEGLGFKKYKGIPLRIFDRSMEGSIWMMRKSLE